MTSIHDYVTPSKQTRCSAADALPVFANPAIDYSPTSDEYAHLTVKEHMRKAVEKWRAERDAVRLCGQCPLLVECQTLDRRDIAAHKIISGVVGGRPEAVRRNPEEVQVLPLRAYVESVAAIVRGEQKAPKQISEKVTTENAAIADGDRGPRGQINDDLVRVLVAEGRTGAQIAHQLGCDPRSVSRAKKRMGLTRNCQPAENVASDSAPKAAAATKTATQATPTPDAPTLDRLDVAAIDRLHGQATSTPVTTPPATPAALDTAPRAPREPRCISTARTPFSGHRKVGAAMTAVFDYLAIHDEADTETLLRLATAHIDDTDAQRWWLDRNSTKNPDGSRTIKPSQANTSPTEQIAAGARGRAFNSLSAAHRNKGHLRRHEDTWSFTAVAKSAWVARRDAVGTYPAAVIQHALSA